MRTRLPQRALKFGFRGWFFEKVAILTTPVEPCAQQLNTVRLALSFFYSKQKLRGILENWLKKPKLKFDRGKRIRKILAK